MKRVGIIGWRGMVGSVLMERMRDENDFQGFESLFFSTSQAGQAGPKIGNTTYELLDAHDVGLMKDLDVILSYPVRAVATPQRFIRSCERSAGRGTGLMPPLPCVWKRIPSLSWIR